MSTEYEETEAAFWERLAREREARLADAERRIAEALDYDDGMDKTTRAILDGTRRPAVSADDVVQAQHDETGRVWVGLRRLMPPGYSPIVQPTETVPAARAADDTGEKE